MTTIRKQLEAYAAACLHAANAGKSPPSRPDIDLARVDLARVDLYGANLSGANLSGAKLSGAHLDGARLFGANLAGAVYGAFILTDGQVRTYSGMRHWAWSAPTTDGRMLAVGCEYHTLDEWEAEADEIRKRQAEDASLEPKIRLLIAHLRALDAAEVRA